MRLSIFVLALLFGLVASLGQAMRYEPREPDPQPYQIPCDVISYWTLLDSMWVSSDDSQVIRKVVATGPRRGDQWLTVCDTDCETDNVERPHPLNRYLVNDQRHSADSSSDPSSSATSSLTTGFPPRIRPAFWVTLLDDWYGRCGDLRGAVKRLN